MGQALYRTYRSKSFDEIVGQDHITKTLSKAIKSGRISHAYLFTGPRGVGKTSVARILAHAVNELPYTGEDTSLDIIEIDAASNRRIDEIRDLRDKIHVAPTSSKYKVYIIDEVHMLTKEAFNALLKTLEEPPAHCIFILATTEAHKLPETIVSRTQRFTFKAIGTNAATEHLSSIANNEGIEIDQEALELLAEYGEGSFRDSISLLDQLAGLKKKITSSVVREYLGLPPAKEVENIYQAVLAGDSKAVLASLENMRQQAADPSLIARLLSARVRKDIVEGTNQPGTVGLLKNLLAVAGSVFPNEALEIALLEAAENTDASQSPSAPKNTEDQPKPKARQDKDDKKSETPKKEGEPVETAAAAKAEAFPEKAAEPSKQSGGSFDLTMWPEVLAAVKQEAAALYTALRLAVPQLDDGKLRLYFEFSLHQKKVNQARHKDIIASAVETVSGAKLAIECLVDKDVVLANKDQEITSLYAPEGSTSQSGGDIESISNIFGSAEVLES